VFHFSNWSMGQKLLDRECLVSWSSVIIENPITGPKFRPFSTQSFTQLLQYFHIINLVWLFGLVEWIQSDQYPWYQRKLWALSSFVILTCEFSWVVVMSDVCIENSVICFCIHIESTVSSPVIIFLTSHKIQCWFTALKTNHSFLWWDVETCKSCQNKLPHNWH